MINWQYYPRSDQAPSTALDVVEAFSSNFNAIDSSRNDLVSNDVLAVVCSDLESSGFVVETGKKANEKIHVPVLFGVNGKMEKYFEADALNKSVGFVLEVEAGRAVLNNQFLKDLFQACMMHEVNYLGIAVRNRYKTSKDFDRVVTFLDTLYASNRLALPLKGILIIGY